MNKLESMFKSKENQSLVCIKYKSNGRIERVQQGVGYNAVEKRGIASYCSREEWKKFRGQYKQKEEVIVKESMDKKDTSKPRLKGAKNIRAANKKN